MKSMNEDRIPFLAIPGGKSDLIARALIDERTAAQQARLDYIKRTGVENLWASERSVAGLIVRPDRIPTGFRKDAKYRTDSDGFVLAVPDGKKRDTYKAALAELASIPSLPGSWDLDSRLGFGGYIKGRTMLFCSCEIIGEKMLLSVPRMEKNQFIPPDCTQLKMSEYYEIKEAAAAAEPIVNHQS